MLIGEPRRLALDRGSFLRDDAHLPDTSRPGLPWHNACSMAGWETRNVKLVVDHAREPRHTRTPDDGSRPALRLVQGGVSRPPRLVPPSAPRDPRDMHEGRTDAVPASVELDDVPIYLRPIPAWVPRLW